MHIFGLTGGIASGKSTVARLMREEFDIPVLDVDAIARGLLAKGTQTYLDVVWHFGPTEIVVGDGDIDRKKLRAIIMENAEERAWLEAATIPRITREIDVQLARLAVEDRKLVGVESALLIQKGYAAQYDSLIIVECDDEVRVKRVMARDGVTEEQARQVLAVQAEGYNIQDIQHLHPQRWWNHGDEELLRACIRAWMDDTRGFIAPLFA